jgi:hypothetical protein
LIKLREKGIITTLRLLFKQSQTKKIEGLIIKSVFEFIQYNLSQYASVRIFNSQLVNKVKGKATDMPFEKSRLVVQAYNNKGKKIILT